MTDKPKDNVKDIFTKKSLTDLEAEALKDKEDKEAYAKEVFTGVLEGILSEVEEGNITGLLISATTKNGVIVPQFVYTGKAAIFEMNYLAGIAKEVVEDTCSEVFNLHYYGEDE